MMQDDELTCGKCDCTYVGDPAAINVCDDCFIVLVDQQGYRESDLFDMYPPTGPTDEDEEDE